MADAINGFGKLQPFVMPKLPEFPFAAAGTNDTNVSFNDVLMQSLAGVNEQQMQAGAAIDSALLGDELTQVEALTAMKKADLSLRLMLQVRNKVIEAYNEIKNMRL